MNVLIVIGAQLAMVHGPTKICHDQGAAIVCVYHTQRACEDAARRLAVGSCVLVERVKEQR
jgi:hypothetical protein